MQKQDKKELEYKNFTCENTPWFLANTASCIVDLPNIEQIATGSYSMRIELWILRTESGTELPGADFDEHKTGASLASKAKAKKSNATTAAGKKSKGSIANDDSNAKAKTPEKTLEVHKKAIREIAYSTNYKILVSVGFDFHVFVWNPYWEKEIISL